MAEKYLQQIYHTSGDTRGLYAAWAKSYDEELISNGYAAPTRCAKALAKHSKDLAAPVLDFGCGTGLSGLALKDAGFETIDGVDISADMLEVATQKQVYRTLTQVEPNAPLLHTPGTYAAIAAIGMIGTGAAPISVFDLIMKGLAKGGLTVISLNDHALEEPYYEGKLNEYIDCGAAQLLHKDYGPHIPGIDLNSNVYVIEKL